jgi:GAF domain-containing protein
MDTTSGMAILRRAIVHVPDIEDPSTHAFVRQSGRLLGFRSVVAVPMLRDGEPVGTINVTRREAGRFSDAEVTLLQTFADQAVIAVDNGGGLLTARLHTEAQPKMPVRIGFLPLSTPSHTYDRALVEAVRFSRGPALSPGLPCLQ